MQFEDRFLGKFADIITAVVNIAIFTLGLKGVSHSQMYYRP